MFDDATVDRPRGRPSRFSDEIATEICERLADGQSLIDICKDENLPAERTIRKWLAEDRNGFVPQYVRAREAQVEHYIDEIVDIADSVANCTDSAIVHAARLAIDTRKWAAAKRLPKKYGDRLDLEHKGDITVKILRFGEE
jgi:hypothetical protein